jgi:hypothetical protein
MYLWKYPVESPSIFLVFFFLFIAFLTGGIVLGMHTYLNGNRDVTLWRHVVNYSLAAFLILGLSWKRTKPNQPVDPTCEAPVVHR